eukprot:scaffold238104_cov15-Tisochrysis_lutea.AAC.1
MLWPETSFGSTKCSIVNSIHCRMKPNLAKQEQHFIETKGKIGNTDAKLCKVKEGAPEEKAGQADNTPGQKLRPALPPLPLLPPLLWFG